MNPRTLRNATVMLVAILLLPACAATRLTTQAQLPPPLIDKLPARVGIYYSKEFSEYIHKETRGQIDYEITLGPAHVTNLNWLMQAMFAELIPVADPTRVAEIAPPLVMVLEPKFEEYSFLTPNDIAGDAYIVTIRYLLTLYDGSGGRVDSFTFTGYGREKARTLANKEPLQVATQRAMRDAGAKVAVEFTDQESVRLLLRNPYGVRPAMPTVIAVPTAQPPSAPGDKPQETGKPEGAAPATTEGTAPPPPEAPPPSTAGI